MWQEYLFHYFHKHINLLNILNVLHPSQYIISLKKVCIEHFGIQIFTTTLSKNVIRVNNYFLKLQTISQRKKKKNSNKV